MLKHWRVGLRATYRDVRLIVLLLLGLEGRQEAMLVTAGEIRGPKTLSLDYER